MREVLVKICDRKSPGYPQHSFTLNFDDTVKLLSRVDGLIDELGIRKADVYMEDEGQFTSEEISALEKEWIMFD